MTKLEAQESIAKLNNESFSLTPSALITLFEIDLVSIGQDVGIANPSDPSYGLYFRFHNTIKLGKTSIYWRNNEYIAAPVEAKDFEMSSAGTFPAPKLTLTTSEEGIPAMAILKERLRDLDDLIGAKVTRIRTFARYLDSINYIGEQPPVGFAPDPNVEFPRDVFYIEKKISENKTTISFGLSSILDTEGLQLPNRLVLADKCMWHYRGEGCLYEYPNRRNIEIHGKASESKLPAAAPPVANVHDEIFTQSLSVPSVIDKGLYQRGLFYNRGDSVFIEKGGLKYYFVCHTNHSNVDPPNVSYWIADTCSKTVRGCKLRWDKINNGIGVGHLPYGGFPSVSKLS